MDLVVSSRRITLKGELQLPLSSFVVEPYAHGAIGRRINPSLSYFSLQPVQWVVGSIPHGEPIELFLIAASAVGRWINPSW